MSLAGKFGCFITALAFGTGCYFAGSCNLLEFNKYSIAKKHGSEYLKTGNKLHQIHQSNGFISMGSLNNLIGSLEQRISNEGFTKEEADKALNLSTKMQIATLRNTKPGSADPSRIAIKYSTTDEGSELLIGYKTDSANYFIPIRDVGSGRIIGGTRKDVVAEGIRDFPELMGEIVKKSTKDLIKDLGIN